MRLPWYLCSLVLSFALFGAIQHYGVQAPNQELVVQFDESTAHSEDLQEYISSVKHILSNFEVEHLKIKSSNNDGFYRITYRSDVAISSIKEALSFLEKSASDGDRHKNAINYDVFEIKAKSQTQWDFEGQLVGTYHLKSDRFSEVKLLKSFGITRSKNKLFQMAKVKVSSVQRSPKFNSKAKGALEIRAGPWS